MSKNKITLNLIGPVNLTGYGNHFINFVSSIAHKWPGKVIVESIGDVQPGVDDFYLRQFYGKADERGISIKIWHDHDLKMPGKYKIGFTVFELNCFERETDIAKTDVIDEIWVPSNWAQGVVKDHHKALNVDIPVSVVHEGVNNKLFTHTATPASFPYAINVGKFEKRKGHLDILDVWEDIDIPLFCLWGNAFVPPQLMYHELGQRGWKSRETINHFGIPFVNYYKPSKPGTIKICAAFVPQENYIKLVKNAYLGVFPFYAEGWNLPLTEAMACGVPCITSVNTGPTQYLNDLNCLGIHKFKEELAVDNIFFKSKEATWMVPDRREFIDRLHLFTKPGYYDMIKTVRDNLVYFGNRHSWDNASEIALRRLNDIVKEL